MLLREVEQVMSNSTEINGGDKESPPSPKLVGGTPPAAIKSGRMLS